MSTTTERDRLVKALRDLVEASGPVGALAQEFFREPAGHALVTALWDAHGAARLLLREIAAPASEPCEGT